MDGIGPKLPLQRDERFGNFGLIVSYREEVKQNFKNLMLTSPGERIMNADFGVGMRNFLFEPKDLVIPKIRQRIDGQVSKYMPYVKINKIQFNHNVDPIIAQDSNVLSITIQYEVPSLNLSTTLVVQSEDTN
jgi:phage baseplate assembly protein W